MAIDPKPASMTQPFNGDDRLNSKKLGLRQEALDAPDSGIVEVFNYGRGRHGLIPLYVGESNLPAPSFITHAMVQSLQRGETFYTYQRGIPELRSALATYMTRHYGVNFEKNNSPFSLENFFVTNGGMHALQIAIRLVAGIGDEVVVLTPAWPNFIGALIVSGATPVEAPLACASQDGKLAVWSLGLERLRAAITPKTRALIVNSPANPTGWTASLDDLKALLEIAREYRLWIIADEIYGRISFTGQRAPSFHDVMVEDDQILFIQSFSKNWAMTGLRIGWIEASAALAPFIENLIQYSTSGVAVPSQRGAIAALEQGEEFFAEQLACFKGNRDRLFKALTASGRAICALPDGGFYVFAQIKGEPDTRELALRLVDEANVGVAPGTAFGKGGQQCVRICFAREPAQLDEAIGRLQTWLQKV